VHVSTCSQQRSHILRCVCKAHVSRLLNVCRQRAMSTYMEWSGEVSGIYVPGAGAGTSLEVAAYLLESPWHQHQHQMEVCPILPANRTLSASTGEAQGQRKRRGEDQRYLMVTSALRLSVMVRIIAVQGRWVMALLVCQSRAYQVRGMSWQWHLRVPRVLRMGC